MINDERIKRVRNRISARGFGIWYFLLLISLLYRQFILNQSVEEYWDIALIFFAGTLYVTFAGFSKGAVQESYFRRYAKWSAPVILITILAVMFYRNQITSLIDLAGVIVSALIGLTLVGFALYYLYRRWEKQNQLTD
jgi:uncharacterized membrane protein YkvI